MTIKKHSKTAAAHKRLRVLLVVVALSAAMAWIWGSFCDDITQLKYMRWEIGPKMIDLAKFQGTEGFTDTSAKQEVHPVYSPADSYCFLIFGQSNVANSSASDFQPRNELYNLYKGKIYKATPPLLGADGILSNPALKALDIFASKHPGKKIFIISISISGSSVFHWAKDGSLHNKLVQAVAEADRAGLPITHVIYHQGETDCTIHTPVGYYKAALKSVLDDVRALGVTAPIFLGQVSMYKSFDCPDVSNPDCYTQCPRLLRAQAELCREIENVHPCVNSDRIVGWSHRYDGYHFDAQGEALFAREMDRILEDYAAKPQ
ncbi:hypothetical protein JCM15519_30030 [Fundidesulfovibrio butyratiphilus]